MKHKILVLFIAIGSIAQLWAKSETKYPDSYAFTRGVEEYTNGNYEDANDWLDKEISDHPDNGYAYLFITALRYQNEEYGKALSAINQTIKKLPKKDKRTIAYAYSSRADIYLVLADTVSALKDFDMAIKLQPNEKDYYERRADVYFDRKQYELADADYRQMISIDPGDVTGYMGIGRNAKERKHYEEALRQFNYAIKLAPDHSYGYSFRADCYMAQKKYNEAIDDIIKALSIGGNNKAYVLLITMDKEALPIAKAKFQVRANKNPNESEWYYYLGALYENNKRYKEAIDFYQQANNRDANAAFLERIAYCYFEMGDYESALECINRAIYMDSDDYDLVMMKGNIYNEMGKYPEAIAELDKYIDKYPDNYYGYYRRGWFKDEANDVDGAIDDYTMSITLEPRYAYAYCGRGRFYNEQGMKELADADFQKVIELDTVPTLVMSCAHFAYYFLGQKEKAVEFMDSIIAKQDDRDGSYYDAACLYSIMGEKEKAVDYLNKAFQQGFRRIAHTYADHDLDNIREMPEYKELIEKYSAEETEDDTNNQNQTSESQTEIVEIPFTKEGGVTKVKCNINGLPLHFIFDTGASDVTLSMVEANFMLKNDYIQPNDIIGSARYVDANGDISEGTVVNLRNVNFGGLELDNVRASVVRNQKAPLLLGQSVLGRLGKIEIDNPGMKLIITHKVNK